MDSNFRGTIKLDVRDSVPGGVHREAPPAGSPVLVVLYDDTGLAAWAPYGGRIDMPTMDRLAGSGLTYGQWHTTSLCSPTRSTFLTGRNPHLNGVRQISEGASGFPGYSSHIPPSNATIATVLRDAGYATLWVGKNHNTPIDAWTAGSPRKEWPLDRASTGYGFIGGQPKSPPLPWSCSGPAWSTSTCSRI